MRVKWFFPLSILSLLFFYSPFFRFPNWQLRGFRTDNLEGGIEVQLDLPILDNEGGLAKDSTK